MATVLHSIYGRHLGTDRDRYITGNNGIKVPAVYCGPNDSELAIYGSTSVQALTSASTGTNMTAAGVTTIGTSSAQTFILDAPVAGLYKKIIITSTTPSTVTVLLSTTLGGNFMTTDGSSFINITLNNQADFLDLHAVSTSFYVVTLHNSTGTFTT